MHFIKISSILLCIIYVIVKFYKNPRLKRGFENGFNQAELSDERERSVGYARTADRTPPIVFIITDLILYSYHGTDTLA